MSRQEGDGVAPAAPEKRVRQLPPLRVSEALELELMRLAAMHDRALSDYVRLVLEKHVFGHATNVGRLPPGGQEDRA